MIIMHPIDACFDDLRVIDGMAVRHCTLAIDRRFPSSHSIEYLHAGRMRWSCDGQAPVIIDRPAVFWHLPGPRYVYGPVDARGWDHHYLLLEGPRAGRLVEALQAVAPQGWLAVPDPGPVRTAMLDALALLQGGGPARRAELAATVALLVARCLAPPGGDPLQQQVAAFAERIRADPLRPWPVAVLARETGCSEVHLRRCFRARTGRSVTAWVLQARMDLARRALASGASVASAGRAAGYEDAAQFSRMFRRVVGVAPGLWRAGMPAVAPGDGAGR